MVLQRLVEARDALEEKVGDEEAVAEHRGNYARKGSVEERELHGGSEFLFVTV